MNTSFFNRVDISKLKRDYLTNPLNKGEQLDKSELKYLFFDLNFSASIIGDYVKKNHATISNWLNKFGYKKDKEQEYKSKLICMEYKTGVKVRNSYEVPGAKEKAEKTCISKYGVKHHLSSKEVINKRKETVIDRYGVDNVAKLDSVQDKIKKTNLLVYGYESPIKNKKVKDKIKATCQKKYGADSIMESNYYKNKCKDFLNSLGVDNISQAHISKESREILEDKEKFKKFIIDSGYKVSYKLGELLGVSSLPILQRIREWGLQDLVEDYGSSIEKEISECLPEIEFHKDRNILDGREIDLYSKEHKIGIEFNGNYWHSDKFEKDIYYHQKKSFDAEKKGVFIYHIWEYEWHDKRTKLAIINQLRNIFKLNKGSIFARKCVVREVKGCEASKFLDANHVQGKLYSGIKLGLYYNNELVSLMCFAANSINKNYQYELNRFCSKAGYNVVGGASKLFKYFIKTYNPKSIISYSDIAKTRGTLYQTLGFEKSHLSDPQYHWTNGTKVISKYKTRLKKLNEAGWRDPNSNESESQVMRRHGFNKLYDCGKIAWIWKNTQIEKE